MHLGSERKDGFPGFKTFDLRSVDHSGVSQQNGDRSGEKKGDKARGELGVRVLKETSRGLG